MTTTRTQYDIEIRDYRGRQIYALSNHGIVSLEYDRVYNDVGSFSLVLVGSQAQWALENLLLPRGLDYLVEIYRLNPRTQRREKIDTYMVRLANPYYTDDQVFFMVIGGFSLNHLLLRRVVAPDADYFQSGGYVTDAGNAGDVIQRLVEAHLGERAIDDRRIVNLRTRIIGTGGRAGARLRFDGLLESVQKLATGGGVQFNIEHEGRGRLLFSVGELFTDRTLDKNYPGRPYTLLKRERGNLVNPSLMLDYQDQKNVVYLRANGNADNETVLEQPGERNDESPYNRVEFVATASRADDEESSIQLLTEAKDALKDGHPQIEFTFPIEDLPGFQWRVDYFLGDLVTAEWQSFKSDLRVTGVQVSVQEDDETLRVTVESEELLLQ